MSASMAATTHSASSNMSWALFMWSRDTCRLISRSISALLSFTEYFHLSNFFFPRDFLAFFFTFSAFI